MFTKKCKVISNQKISDTIYEMVIEDDDIAHAAKPGQFLHIKTNVNSDALLRRPISICEVNQNKITIVYQLKGKGTKELCNLKATEIIDLLGPIGNSFPIFLDKKCAIIGGGIGIAPLLELSKRLADCDAYLGFQSMPYKVKDYERTCKNVIISTEDGSYGNKGFITDFMNDISKYEIVYTCGPKIMMNKVKSLCKEASVKCYLSVEERMGCGIGACLVCVCKTHNLLDGSLNYKKVCVDGPVFDAMEVVLDD